MCGICGIVDIEDSVELRDIIMMRDQLAHRGPDDSGAFVDWGVGLGHRRLSIIDLTEAGHQPMVNENHTLYLVFNGEIYNYVELRKCCSSVGTCSGPTLTVKLSSTRTRSTAPNA